VLADARLAIRTLTKHPAFALAAILSLALGIGANTAVFSVVYALLLRPLPYADPDRLVILWNRSPGLNITEDWFSTAQYFDVRSSSRSFEQLGIALGFNMNLVGDGDPERVGTIRVSSNVLPMLGARPAAGSLFAPEDDVPGRPGTAVLADSLWARRYGRDPAVVGKIISLNAQPYRVIGVLPRRFTLPREVLPTLGVIESGEVFLPLPLGDAAATVRTREDYNIIGKLARGVPVQAAQAEIDAITARLRRDHPDVYPPNGGLTFSVVPLQDEVTGDVRRPLVILFGAVGLVLAVACANVANLLLARAMARTREIAVRAALGASRRRLVSQLLTESLVIALAGGGAGVLLATLGVRWIHLVQPKDVPLVGAVAISPAVLLFTLGLSVVAALVFGLVPALGASRVDLYAGLNTRGADYGGSADDRPVRPAKTSFSPKFKLRALAAIELALALTLLIGAGLLIRSFRQVLNVPPGFNPRGVLSFELSLTGRQYADSKIALETYRQLWERLERLPGVTSSGGVTTLPLSDFFAWGPITVEGRPLRPGEPFVNADQRTAGGRYFETLQIPLIEGRLFNEQDVAGSLPVAIVDQRMAEELWPNASPVGKRLKFGDAASESPWETVVGVVGRVKQYALDADSRMALYRPQTQRPARTLYVVLRTTGDAASLARAVTAAVHAIDPEAPVYRLRTMDARVAQSMATRRFAMTLLALFAGLACGLAAVGVYGVMAYQVSQGTREVGIRIALGATPGAIVKLVMHQGFAVAAAGVALGLAGAFALTRLIESQLFGVAAADPATYVTLAAAPFAIALAATFIPARRAANTDAMASLRAE
jgi:predicted permease